ncbi:MAG: UDP-N-acetylmuramoyl-L-alanyl-D-glutamate--2,6-diaminopimelate ligase [bacterium]|nr:UDP-N-acetylmuramoyl-L-alanyl-D-glutamate--2,6-diaminopimelate ligase [bacterium]
MPMLYFLKKLVPKSWFSLYHRSLAVLAASFYGHPSKKLIVIGVTGTNGKTTVTYLLAKALEASGFQTGCTSTAIIKVGDKEWLNKTKNTMRGRFFLQRTLADMVKAGCRYAVIETSSQGLIQSRHIGVAYDVAVFTNLTPEHIEAHGGFENYKKAKRVLFDYLATLPSKVVSGQLTEKSAVLNADDEHADYFAIPGLKQVWFSRTGKKGMIAEDVAMTDHGSDFRIGDVRVHLALPGAYNIENALAVLATCQHLGVDLKAAAEKIAAVSVVPGRFERVEAGQPWTAIVDYAPEPESFRRLYEALQLIPHHRVIHVLGSCGGGRDVARRPILGQLAAERADIVIVTNEDPYDDDPEMIINQVADGAIAVGKKEGETLYKIVDRREAIFKAMSLAQADDLVVMTGKGCEPWICLAQGKKQPWDEVAVAKEAIAAALKKSGENATMNA